MLMTPCNDRYTRGGTADVTWSMRNNHGGGYSYRLCKTPTGNFTDLTEECFKATQLDFVMDKQEIVFPNGTSVTNVFYFSVLREACDVQVLVLLVFGNACVRMVCTLLARGCIFNELSKGSFREYGVCLNAANSAHAI